MSPSTQLIEFLEQLTVSEGGRAGEHFTALEWQKDFIRGAFADGVIDADLTVARGNGKSTLLSAVALGHVIGPMARSRGEVVLCAASFEQAAIIFRHAVRFARDLLGSAEVGRRKGRLRTLDSTNQKLIECRQTGARLRCIGSDPKRAHGLAPILVLADEPAQWPAGIRDAMLSALRTARGKQPGSRFIALGTKPAADDHWFSRRLEDPGPRHYVQRHDIDRKDLDRAIEDPEMWHAANPSLAFMPDLLDVMREEAEEAKRDPGLRAAFRSLRLNGGTSDVANRDMLVDPEAWAELLVREPPPREGIPCWGLDLGAAAAMSAICSVWPNGRLETVAAVGCGKTLDERARADHAGDLYRMAEEGGELIVCSTRTPSIAELFEYAESVFGGVPGRIVTDRWRLGELKDGLEGERGKWARVELVSRGQGYRDGGDDCRAWRKAIAAKAVYPVAPCRLLTSALAEACTTSDPSGNEKLAKNSEGGRRLRARDDVAAAAVLAVGHALYGKPPKPAGRRLYGGLVG